MLQVQNRVRLNLEVSDIVKDRIDRLLKVTDAESMAEVIRCALSIYEIVVDTNACGGKVILRSPKAPSNRSGIDDEPSPQTRAICGAHADTIADLARMLGQTRATILRSIIDQWTHTPEGRALTEQLEVWRASRK